MKKEKNIICVCILIMLGLIGCFTVKVEAKSNTCNHVYGIESTIDHTYHYKKCMYCGKEVQEKHTFNKEGVCYTCKQSHKEGNVYKSDKNYHYTICTNAKCRIITKYKHTWEEEKYGKIIENATCTKKGKRELECTASRMYTKKDNRHKKDNSCL